MSEGRFKKITKRVTRFFSKEKLEVKQPRPISASQVIKPEEAVPEHGKVPPRSTVRRPGRYEHLEQRVGGVTITELPWGVTHVSFNALSPESGTPEDTIRARDPVTRRLSRKKLSGGMKRTTGFYDESGVLYDETNTDW